MYVALRITGTPVDIDTPLLLSILSKDRVVRVHHSAARNFNTESVTAEINAHTNK